LLTHQATVKALEAALDIGDQSAPGHCRRVAKLSVRLATQLGIAGNDLVALEYGALLHDIGKLGVPDTILMKPGPLTAEEWTTMRKHPEIGCEIVGNIDFLADALPVIRHHHEHYDGNGYPDALRGDEIPILARIFAVIDSFDAQTNWRPYNIVRSTETALDNIRKQSGTLHDPHIVDQFVHMIEGQGLDVEVASPGLRSLAEWTPDIAVQAPALSGREMPAAASQERQHAVPWPKRVLAVDDEAQVTDILVQQLSFEGFDVATTNDSTEVLRLLGRDHYDLVLLDIKMSPPDGLTLLQQIRKQHPYIAIVMLTASDDAETAARAMREGATDYIVKPYKQVQLVSRIEHALEYSQLLRERAMAKRTLERRVEAQTRRLRAQSRQLSQMLDQLLITYRATIKTLEAALDAGDQSAPGHCRRVAKLSGRLAARLGIAGNDLVALEYGALLHDIGKLGIPDTILMKPGPLTAEEWDIMRRHPALGCEIVGNIDFLVDALPVIRHHHEHYNGNGYPDALQGDAIPVLARIFAVVDSFDAQTNWRPYKDTYSADTALRNIQADSGRMYDPAIVDAFTAMIREQEERSASPPSPPSD
jgi:putative nucleotidyltransferase with HDIG domain